MDMLESVSLKPHSFQNKPVSPQAAQQLVHFKKKISNVASLLRTLYSKDEQFLNQWLLDHEACTVHHCYTTAAELPK